MAEIKKLMEKDKNSIERQFFPETVSDAVIGLDKKIEEILVQKMKAYQIANYDSSFVEREGEE